MAEAKKTKSGKWTILVYSHTDSKGKRVYQRFTADKKRDAEMMAKEFEVGRKKEKRPSDMTVLEMIRKYIDMKKNILSPSTIRGYETIYKNAFPDIGNVEIKSLDQKMIQTEINKVSADISPKTIRNIYGLFLAALDAFVPSMKVDLSYPQPTSKEMKIPSEDDIRLLLANCGSNDMKLIIKISSSIGLRRGEICGIKIKDIDLKNKTINIIRSIAIDANGNPVEKQPKTKSGVRLLDVPEFLIPEIERKMKNKTKEDYLIDMSIKSISRRFSELVQKTGIEKISFHSLRHYYASVMLANNVPSKYAMRRMGHATDNMLKRVYQHTMDEKEKEVTDTMNSYMNNVFK